MLNKTIDGLNMPPDYRTGLVGQTKEFGRAAANFVIAFLLSIVFMYMVLAAQFESFIDPITILLSLPLSVPFALLSLLLMGENFSDHLLVGRNSGAVRHREEELDSADRSHQDTARRGHAAAGSDFPGMHGPAAADSDDDGCAGGGHDSAGSRRWRRIGQPRTVAIVVIGGQTLCLLLTLLVTPVAYSMFDDIAHAPLWGRLGSLFRLRRPRRAAGSRRLML